ncbi:RNA polymerase III RPC4-domain-containing protein [Ganoderma leucocontextum]|nr:RNA polymerase III RPC4-domain-containing protein [Ganoderma leucocontextum]
MSEQPSGSGTPGSGSSTPGKAIASLAKKQSDITRLGAQKLKFVPALPPRRVKEEPKKDEPVSTPSADRGRGRGADRGRGRGRGRGGAEGAGRGAAPRPPAVEMTASGPFAMGPALAGPSARRAAPRSNFAPVGPPGATGSAKLGAGLTQTTAPSLKKENERERDAETGATRMKKEEEEEEEAYSDPDEGVEIVDMENVRQMDWMAPESLRKEREAGKKKGKGKKEGVKMEHTGVGEAMDVDREGTPEEEVNMANAVDLSESESEEELEDIIDDFAQTQEQEEDADTRQERLYFFQFPEPFPVFQPPHAQQTADVKGKGKAEPGTGEDSTKKVTFAEDTKPPALGAAGANGPATADKDQADESPTVDGVIGQLEIYESGTVKMRMRNGIVMDVTAATQPTFLQHAIYLDSTNKRLCVLGEVNRRFVVTPDLDALLSAMELADNPPPAFELGEGLLTMDTT